MQHQSRRILMMRHAKAQQSGRTDTERELSPRGYADAGAAGAWLAGQGITPDHALVSAAVRTRQTWAAVAAAAGWHLEATFDQGLYTAGPETALDIMRATPAEVSGLLVIGHNPTIAFLAQMLDDGEGDEAATTEMATGYPTCAVAVLAYPGPWAELDQGTARVEAFHVGRG